METNEELNIDVSLIEDLNTSQTATIDNNLENSNTENISTYIIEYK